VCKCVRGTRDKIVRYTIVSVSEREKEKRIYMCVCVGV